MIEREAGRDVAGTGIYLPDNGVRALRTPGPGAGQHSWRFLAACLRDAATVTDAVAAFAARRSRRTGRVRPQTHRRDRTRNLPPALRDLTLRAFGRRILQSNYRPLPDPI